MYQKLCIALLLVLQAVLVLTARIEFKECTNDADKCTAKDPRKVYPKCMLYQTDLWCDHSNYTRVPDPNKIYPHVSCKHASALYINDSCLTDLYADDLQKYPSMKIFKCDRNYISKLQENLFSGNKKLENIDFCSNKISFIHRKTFQELSSLKSLNFANNKLDSIDSRIFEDLESLMEISFHNNEIAVVDGRSFVALKQLRVLILTGNKIRHIDEQAFDGLDSLTHLHLDGNKLHELSSGTFVKLRKLEVLTMSYNAFVHWPLFDENSLSIVHTLNLAHNLLEEFEASNVANLSNLQNLSLENNSLRVLPKDIFLGTPRLRYLDVSYNNLEVLGEYTFSSLCHLETINIQENKLKTPQPEWFANIIKNGEKEGNNVGGNFWNCDCAAVPYGLFLETLNSSWAENLRVQCHTPKQLREDLLDSYVLQNIKRKFHCPEQVYKESTRSCNATPHFTRKATLYTYIPTTEEVVTSSSRQVTLDSAGDTLAQNQEFQSVTTESTEEKIESHVFLIVIVICAALFAGLTVVFVRIFCVHRRRNKENQSVKSARSASTTSSSLEPVISNRTDQQPGVYDKLQRDGRVVSSGGDSGLGENENLFQQDSPNDSSTRVIRVQGAGELPATTSHSDSDYMSMAPALSSEETLPKYHASESINDDRRQRQPTAAGLQGVRHDPEGGNC